MKKIRLLLIEDNRLLRDGIFSILKPHKNILIIAASGDGKHTLVKIKELKPSANGFILKDASLNDFLITIRTVNEGATVLPPLLIDSLFSQIIDNAIREGKSELKKAVKMTQRERDVIGLLSDGMSNKEIGQKIRISTYTVKSHIHNIMEKLALHTRLEIANYSYTDEALNTISKSISMINN